MPDAPGTTDPLAAEPAFYARLNEVREQADAGAFEAAEAHIRAALQDARGVHAGNEAWSLNFLITTYGRGGRLFEALALARRYAEIAREAGSDDHLAVALGAVCGSLHCLELARSLGPALKEMGALIPRLTGKQRQRAEREWHESSFVFAVIENDLDRARTHLAEFRSLLGGDARGYVDDIVSIMHGVNLELRAGSGERALALLNTMSAELPPEPMMHFEVDAVWIQALTLDGQHAKALERTRDFLQRSAELANEPFHAMARIHNLLEVAGLMVDPLDEPLLAHEAYDQLAAAIVMRIAQLDQCVEDLPELGLGESAQERELVAMRKEFVREQRGVMRRVAKLMESTHREALEALIQREAGEGWIRLCAWCERVSLEGDRWIPVGHFVPRGHGIRMTHAICPACRANWE